MWTSQYVARSSDAHALYPVFVHRLARLLHASFRPRLATIALAFSLALHLHQVGRRTFTSKLLSMPSTLLKQAALAGLKREIDGMVETLRKVVHQAKARVFGGDTHVEGKVLSVFETSTEVIRKGKANKPTEFGKMVKIQEAENQIVIDCQVYDEKPSDSDLLIPSIETHQTRMGRVPDLAAADAGFYS